VDLLLEGDSVPNGINKESFAIEEVANLVLFIGTIPYIFFMRGDSSANGGGRRGSSVYYQATGLMCEIYYCWYRV